MLTAREHDILKLIARGRTIKQMARELALSDETIRSYRKLLYKAIDARNAPHAVAIGFQRGYLGSEA